jgi:putative sigma-54 modulation protein
MSIEIRSRDFSITDAIRDHARRRLGFALNCFAIDRLRKVRRVVVRVGDLNGPKGGEDKFCRITAEVGHGTVVVEDVHSNLYSAISGATHRLALKVSRTVARAHRLSARTRASSADSFHARESFGYPFTPPNESTKESPGRMLSWFMGGNEKLSSLTAVESL